MQTDDLGRTSGTCCNKVVFPHPAPPWTRTSFLPSRNWPPTSSIAARRIVFSTIWKSGGQGNSPSRPPRPNQVRTFFSVAISFARSGSISSRIRILRLLTSAEISFPRCFATVENISSRIANRDLFPHSLVSNNLIKCEKSFSERPVALFNFSRVVTVFAGNFAFANGPDQRAPSASLR